MVEENKDPQGQFDKIYQTVLKQVTSNWDAALQKKSLKKEPIEQSAQLMVDFSEKNKEEVNLFQSGGTTPYYYLNVVNVGWYSILVGMELGFSRDKLIELATAALWHDIGMSKIDSALLTKKEKLSYDEYEKIRSHPEDGKNILSAADGFSEAVIQGVFQEHERENGSGYPEGCRGKQIHEYAKIIGLTDVFEAMTHHRDYRDPVSPYDAVMELLEMKNQLIQDKYIKSFINVFTFYPVGSYVQLNTDEVGRVIEVKRKFPTRPTVEILIDKEGDPISSPFDIKLTDENLIYIKETLTEEKARFALGR